jgi:hypothetical protein
MPAYDAINFRPPAPTTLVTLRSLKNGTTFADVPMLLDTGADVSLVPRSAIAPLLSTTSGSVQYEVEAFDGMRTTSSAVELEMQFLGKSFRGQFLLIDGPCGIIGRNILNNLALILDGLAQSWSEKA